MATPSKAELISQLQAIIKFYKQGRIWAEDDGADDFLSMEDALSQALESDYPDAITAGIQGLRATLSAYLADPAPLSAHLRDWARFLNSPATDPTSILVALYRYMIDNADTVVTRGFTFGSITAAGGNTGTGTIVRVTKDDRSYDIENCTPEAKEARCVSDANSGAERNREVFSILGSDASRDGVETLGSGLSSALQAVSPADSLLLNPSFDAFSGDAATPTDISNWTSSVAVVGDGSDYTFDSANFYLPKVRSTDTLYSLNVKLTRTLTQKLDIRGTQIDPGTPYYCQVAWNRAVGGATGTLELHMGAVSNSVVVAAQVGWQTLVVPATLGSSNWYRAWVEEGADIKIVWTRTAGELLLDDLIFVPMTFLDGLYYAAIPGATPFRAGTESGASGDRFTWTDSATESVIQRWLARHYGLYLPHAAGGGATIADP